MLKQLASDYLMAIKLTWWMVCFVPFAIGLSLVVAAIFMAHGTRAPVVIDRIFQ